MVNTALSFSSKAGTLQLLSTKLTTARVLPMLKLSVGEWLHDSQTIVENIVASFPYQSLIVRSSCHDEDTLLQSQAGRYRSIANVPSNDRESIRAAIQGVIDSYGEVPEKEAECFVQPFLKNVVMAGVALTATLAERAPYFVINYDESGSTSSVTQGVGDSIKTYIQLRSAPFTETHPLLGKVIQLCRELLIFFSPLELDIEFAIDSNRTLYLLQVRPLSLIVDEFPHSLDFIQRGLDNLYKKVEKQMKPRPGVLGKKSIFGVMTDWNPAEMIGLRPSPLALSLYKELITDHIWAQKRFEYGYRNMQSHPLLLSFLGIPYIDIRASFNSFVPVTIPEEIAEKLVEFYLDKLRKNPQLHDKVEFQIVYSCFYLGIERDLKNLAKYGFSVTEIKIIKESLRALTLQIMDPQQGLFKRDLEKVELIHQKRLEVLNSDLSLIEKIYWLNEHCKTYGTSLFAGIARAGFIAVKLLDSLVSEELISIEDRSYFMRSLNTISKQIQLDTAKLSVGEIIRDEFLKKYGHLRPHAYDILSLRYDEAFDHYFGKFLPEQIENDFSFKFSDTQLNQIQSSLERHQIQISAQDFISFIKQAVEAREYSKFVFTALLSDILQLIVQLGERANLEREELSFLDFKLILNLYSSVDSQSLAEQLQKNVRENKHSHLVTRKLQLPALIIDSVDVHTFHEIVSRPNFITQINVKAEVVTEDKLHTSLLKGKIVCIEAADPGYDFLLTKGIAGLITKYGGINSHMAIRCAELGIPAVIGAGSSFQQWAASKILEIQPVNQLVRVES
ncbi:MAG: hypothetical protein K0S74_916 [Chlamydiales bacterium]|jgi:phosphohistidine swiveling domain-containing protein|nr:hypothetical protein [Chlamydiales bacterium]